MLDDGEYVLDTVMAGNVIARGLLARAQRRTAGRVTKTEDLEDLEAVVRLRTLVASVLWVLGQKVTQPEGVDDAIRNLLERIPPETRASAFLNIAICGEECREALGQAAGLRRTGYASAANRLTMQASHELLKVLDEALSVCTNGYLVVACDGDGALELVPRSRDTVNSDGSGRIA